MKNMILFGAGVFGEVAYYKLKEIGNILFYVDNDKNKSGCQLHGVEIINMQKLEQIYDKKVMDVVISSRYFSEIGKQLSAIGITKYYICVEGLLYKKGPEGEMVSYPIGEMRPYQKSDNTKSILFVQNTACIRTHKIANAIKKYGWNVFLAYSMISPEYANQEYADIYDHIYEINSINQLITFINESEFDYVHSSNEPDLLSMVLNQTNKTIIHDCHDLSSAYKSMTPEEMAVEFVVNKYSSGVIYTTEGIRQDALKKFKIPKERTFVLENLISSELYSKNGYEKLSVSDHELHCVYEGGVIPHDKESHRYFEKIWRRLAECGVHVHFYTNCEEQYCAYLESLHEKIHYEGNFSSRQLAVEMSKYDVGLCILNVTEKNRQYLEYASPNKISEYVNAGIPVAVGNIESQVKLVEDNGFGKEIDLTGNIWQQMSEIAQIKIKDNILAQKGLTFESKIPKLMEFYQRCRIDNITRRTCLENN